MHRKRRHLEQRTAMPRKLDTPVLMAAYSQNTEKWLDWHGRRVTMRHAEQMVASGEAQRLTRKTDRGLITLYRESKPSRASQPTPCSLTMRTMLAAARQGERNLSASEMREVAKLTMWVTEFDRKNPATVGPHFGEKERAAAQAMLDRARGVNQFRPREVRAEVRVGRYAEQAA